MQCKALKEESLLQVVLFPGSKGTTRALLDGAAKRLVETEQSKKAGGGREVDG